MTSHGIRRIERLNYILGGIAIIVAVLTVSSRPALGVALGVILTCLNFAALRWLVFRWTAAVKEGDERGSNRIYLILPKMVGMMGAVALIVVFLPINAVGFIVGYSIFMPSIVIGAALEALAPAPSDDTPPAAGDAPSPSPSSAKSQTHG
ncbi:MAG TPA: ATP synthase subunit I [Kofleriaceae bacterium]|nr:ATP synthase subunit I [Kofleriaceae bacterium]